MHRLELLLVHSTYVRVSDCTRKTFWLKQNSNTTVALMKPVYVLLSFVQFIDQVWQRDELKKKFPGEPRAWTADPFLRTQKILGLKRCEHAGTAALNSACSNLDANFALALGIIYRCTGSNLGVLEFAGIPNEGWPHKLANWKGKLISNNAYRPTAW